jgi:hypothetical protein
VTANLATANGRVIVTRTCSSLSKRPGSLGGDPIVKALAGTITISGHTDMTASRPITEQARQHREPATRRSPGGSRAMHFGQALARRRSRQFGRASASNDAAARQTIRVE